MEKNQVVVSVGSNSPQKAQQVQSCIGWLKLALHGAKCSSVYETQALGAAGQPSYMNCVVMGYTDDNINQLTQRLKDYEQQCGRTPQSKAEGCIPIDIDVVIWQGKVVKERDYNQYYFKKGWGELSK